MTVPMMKENFSAARAIQNPRGEVSPRLLDNRATSRSVAIIPSFLSSLQAVDSDKLLDPFLCRVSEEKRTKKSSRLCTTLFSE